MARFLPNSLVAAALMASAATVAPVFMAQPALAYHDDYGGAQISFQVFYDRLAPYGSWFESGRWGYVWQPEDVGPDFRPYYNGHWVYTDRYGWYWVSGDPWGDIAYHYGRWVYDPDDGWLWVPGYVWAPAWVVWREGDGVTGWFPMPPDDGFYDGDEDYNGYRPVDDYYGYDRWYGPSFNVTFFSLFIFVDNDHFGDEHFHHFIRRDFDRHDTFVSTHDQTNITVVNNFVVNKGVDPQRMQGRNGRSFRTVRLEDVERPDAPRPVPVAMGRQIHHREVQERADFKPRWMQQGGTLHESPFKAHAQPKPMQTVPENGPQTKSKPFFAPQNREQGTPPERRFEERRRHETPENASPSDNSAMPQIITPSSEPERRNRFERPEAPQSSVHPDVPAQRFEHFAPPQNAEPRQEAPVRRFERHESPPDAVSPQMPVQRLEHAVPPPEQVERRGRGEGPPAGDQAPREERRHDNNPQGDENPREHRRHNPEF